MDYFNCIMSRLTAKGSEYGSASGSSCSEMAVHLVHFAGQAGFIGCPEGQKQIFRH